MDYVCVKSTHCRDSSPEKFFSPDTGKMLKFKSNSLKWEEFDLIAEARASQSLSDNQQFTSLNEK